MSPEESKPRAGERLKRLNKDPRVLKAVTGARKLLPGDDRYGDPLSTGGEKGSALMGRLISEAGRESPGALREMGLGALQVWQALAEAQGRGRGEVELAIVFTDLVEFSDWALTAGDEATLDLLRQVSEAIEPPVTGHHGKVVKRLGDGMMAVFSEPRDGLDALVEARERLDGVKAPGYEPRIRAGLHVGKPRRIGGDYLGIDVNIAARVAEEAGAGEILVSDRAAAALEGESIDLRKKRFFRAKGVPRDVTLYSLERKP